MRDELLTYLAEHYNLDKVLEIGDDNELLFTYILEILKKHDEKMTLFYDLSHLINKD